MRVIPRGGWAVSNRTFSITYQPTRHADRFVKQWLDLAGKHIQVSDASRQIFEQLAKANGAGQCVQCHSVELTENGSLEGPMEITFFRRSNTPLDLLLA